MIHPTAIIDQDVKLSDDVDIGAYACIEKGVSLGAGIKIQPYAHIKGNTEIGEGTSIATGAVIGESPQIIGHKNQDGKIRIGKNNVIREYVTIHTSSSPEKCTEIGDNNYLMGLSHVAHDCKIGNRVIICNGTLIAGHVHIDDQTFISGHVTVHQFVRIGRLAMIAGLSRVNQDVPPFMMVVGDSRVWGINGVGLRRAGFSQQDIQEIKRAHQHLYRSGLSVKKALDALNQENSEKIQELISFIASSQRGICGPKKSTFLEKLFLDYPYFVRMKSDWVHSFNRYENELNQKESPKTTQ
ncbi:MAG: acyl-ACP--UDP-N-acetylglucosamine O-acyltransferase [Candidatus Omnitrophota bacterium]